MFLVNTLSRAYLPTDKVPSSSHSEVVHQQTNVAIEIEHTNMADYIPLTQEAIAQIEEETAKDPILQQLQLIILQVWLNKNNLPPDLIPYYSYRDEVVVQHNIIYRNDRCVLPKSMRANTFQKIHSSHLGIVGCQRRARKCIFWLVMTADIAAYVRLCKVCQALGTQQQNETLTPHQIPSRPWSKVGLDIFTLSDQHYLITVDHYSNFWEIDRFDSIDSATVIRKLKSHYARYGIQSTVVSDNGPQFTLNKFKDFAKTSV